MRRFLGLALTLIIVAASAVATPVTTERAIFGMGCFWCAESAFEGKPGVIKVTSGYSGGTSTNPKYEDAHDFGHAEVIEIVFDPAKISYDKLLFMFWRNIDPVSVNGQFCDRGPQYRSIVYATTPQQKAAALASKAALEAMGKFKPRIATEILDAKPFYPAEEYHQDYAVKNPLKYEYYRFGCGRDARLDAVWGAEARGGAKH
jgi:peptide-methionine (S)-S-oxide reductase